MIFLQLFWEFFKTGLFSVGGGMATIPFLQEISARTGWFTSNQLADMIAVAESTPGPLGVNTATYVGYTVGSDIGGVPLGILGATVATLGLIIPSIVVITIIAYILDKFRKNKYVDAAFYGLRPASVGLISAAGIAILLLAFFHVNSIYDFSAFVLDIRYIVLAAVIFVLTNWSPKVKNEKMKWIGKIKKLHPIYFIAFSALVGIIFQLGQ